MGIPFPVDHVQDGAHSAAVTGRKTAGVKVRFLDGIRIKGGKNTAKVIGIVDGNPVQHDQVLVRRAAPHVQSAGVITGGLDTWKHLQGSKYVRFHKSRG